MPLGRYRNFDDCVKDQVDNNDRSEEEAKNICGALEKRMGNAALVSEALHKKYGLSRLSHQAAQRVMKAPMNNNNGGDNAQTLERVPAEEAGTMEEETPEEEAIDMEMEGPTFDDLGADQIKTGDPAAEYDMGEDGTMPTLDDNMHFQQHQGFKMAAQRFDAAIATDLSPDRFIALDARLYEAAGKCSEGRHKGEICLLPPDGYPVTENGKLSVKRVRAAIAYGSKFGVLSRLKANGLCGYADKAGVESVYCKKGGGTQGGSSSLSEEEDSTPDKLFILDAALLKSAAKCTEGEYKGEICLAPPDGWPVTENGKLSEKRVRSAIQRGVQFGKITTLKRNGLCRYAKAAGVDTKFCQDGTTEGSLYSASLDDDDDNYKIRAFEQNNKLFIKAFLLDTGMNLNDWGVSPATLDANISSYIGKPICLQEDFDHPNSGDDNLQHQLSYQDNFRIGTIVDINRHGTRYDAIAEITDDNAKSAFRSGNLPLYVSPQLYHTGAHKEGQENMTEWVGTHLAIVEKPAFGVRKANIGSQCTGDSGVCLAQLKKASLIREHGYGNCGFCNYRLLMSKARV